MITAAIITAIIAAIYALICHLLYWAASLLGVILDAMCSIFNIFTGVTSVVANGKRTYLLDAFFSNGIVSAVYKGMAIIGIAMTLGFAIAAVIKKSFDSSGEKVKATYGMIIGNVCKAILLILLLTAIVSATISATGVLMRQINQVFDNAKEIDDPSEIYFDDNDYATMFRILDTIANYSLNPAYNNRYNINACFNAIRSDMQVLDQNKVFNFSYDVGTEAQNSWQAALLKIFCACDVYEELPIDKYNESLTRAMLSCMDKMQQDGSFKPLSYYYRGYSNTPEGELQLGKMVMLISSFDAAYSSKYNKNPSLYDSLRRPYMQGSKSVYNLIDVEGDFCLSFGWWNHFIAIFVNLFLIWEFLIMLINAVARIFNIIILYITAPFFASVMPLDDGGKMKQWTTAFIIQSLSIFGSVIAIRLLMIFIPIVMGSEIQISNNVFISTMARIALIIGMAVTAEKSSGMISGILADNAGYQAIMAGDVGSGLASKATALAGASLKLAGKAAGMGLKAGADATGLTSAVNAKKDSISNKFQAMRDKGGYSAAKKSGWKTNAQDEKQKDKDEQQGFRKDVLSRLDKLASPNQSNNQSSQSGNPNEEGPQTSSVGTQYGDNNRQEVTNENGNGGNGNGGNGSGGNGSSQPENMSKSHKAKDDSEVGGRGKGKENDKGYFNEEAYNSFLNNPKDDTQVNYGSRPTLDGPTKTPPPARPRSNGVYSKGGQPVYTRLSAAGSTGTTSQIGTAGTTVKSGTTGTTVSSGTKSSNNSTVKPAVNIPPTQTQPHSFVKKNND